MVNLWTCLSTGKCSSSYTPSYQGWSILVLLQFTIIILILLPLGTFLNKMLNRIASHFTSIMSFFVSNADTKKINDLVHDLDSRSQKCIDTKEAHISFNSAWIFMKFGTLVDALNTFNSSSDRFLKIQNGRFYGETRYGIKCQFLNGNRYHSHSSF